MVVNNYLTVGGCAEPSCRSARLVIVKLVLVAAWVQADKGLGHCELFQIYEGPVW